LEGLLHWKKGYRSVMLPNLYNAVFLSFMVILRLKGKRRFKMSLELDSCLLKGFRPAFAEAATRRQV